MPSWPIVLGFAGAAFVIIAIPGPSVLFTLGRSIALGRRAGITSVAGTVSSSFVLSILIAVGVGALVLAFPIVDLVIKYVGAAYLVFLGIQTILARRRRAEEALSGTKQPLGVIFRQSFVVGVTNPKTVAFFVAVLPQFARADAPWPIWGQLMVYGLIWCGLGFLSDGTWALVAGSARDWFAKTPRRIEVLTTIGGAFIVGLGIVLALLP